MGDSPRRVRPDLASTDRQQTQGDFAALVGAALRDADLAQGLASAYAGFPIEARKYLVRAVVEDAKAQGLPSSPVLAWLLSVEEDVGIARTIAKEISATGGAGLHGDQTRRALASGDEQRGGVLVILPLHGRFVDVRGVVWDTDAVTAIVEPAMHEKGIEQLTNRYPGPWNAVPLSLAIDTMAQALWSRRDATARLTQDARLLADLLSLE